MTKKSLILVVFVSACSLALAGTKSYKVAFDRTTIVGATQLAAGEYKLEVQNGTATFTDVHTRKSVTAPAKVENGSLKFAQTAVETSHQGKTDRVVAIDLGGSTTKVEFSAATAAHSGT